MCSWIISCLFGIKVCGFGVSDERVLTIVASDQTQLLYRNAKQMKKIVQATYKSLRFDDQVLTNKELGFNCDQEVSYACTGNVRMVAYIQQNNNSDGQKLACLWQKVVSSVQSQEDGYQKEKLYDVSHTVTIGISVV